MPRRRHTQRFGLPEAVLVGLLCALLVLAIAWFRVSFQHSWLQIPGEVLTAEVFDTHANSQDYLTKVDLRYAYTVDGISFDGRYTGAWPEFGSPNALNREQLPHTLTQGFPLTVFYDPQSPSRSNLHGADETQRRFFFWSFAAALLVAGYYLVAVYPRWRGGSRRHA